MIHRGLPVALLRRAVSSVNVTEPGPVEGVAAWYKADSLNLADDDPVATWNDSSGNGHDATGSVGYMPVFKTAILNGKPVVRFDGATRHLTVSNHADLNPTTLSLFVVAALGGTTNIQGFVGKAASVWSEVSYGLRFIPSGSYGFFAGPTPNEHSVSGADTAAHVIVATCDGSTLSIHKDGTSLGSMPWTNPLPSSSSPLYIGAYAGGGGLGYLLGGDIAEILIYGPSLSEADRDSNVAYLKEKWGLA